MTEVAVFGLEIIDQRRTLADLAEERFVWERQVESFGDWETVSAIVSEVRFLACSGRQPEVVITSQWQLLERTLCTGRTRMLSGAVMDGWAEFDQQIYPQISCFEQVGWMFVAGVAESEVMVERHIGCGRQLIEQEVRESSEAP